MTGEEAKALFDKFIADNNLNIEVIHAIRITGPETKVSEPVQEVLEALKDNVAPDPAPAENLPVQAGANPTVPTATEASVETFPPQDEQNTTEPSVAGTSEATPDQSTS